MRRAAKILLILALSTFAVGVLRWYLESARVSQEKRDQEPIARLAFDLSRQDGWKSVDYTADRMGLYAIVLETRGLNWESRVTAGFAGVFAIELVDPSGKVVKKERYDPQLLYHTNENHVHWTSLGTSETQVNGLGRWKLRVATLQADPNFAATTSAVVVYPPAKFDPGWASLGAFFEFILFSVTGVLLLFCSAFLSHIAKRKTRLTVAKCGSVRCRSGLAIQRFDKISCL
jgi:hypothetical protein